jgi:hypothetical protein
MPGSLSSVGHSRLAPRPSLEGRARSDKASDDERRDFRIPLAARSSVGRGIWDKKSAVLVVRDGMNSPA